MDAKKFEEMKSGLKQAIDVMKGKKVEGVRHSYRISPASAKEVKTLRVSLRMTQVKFAWVVGESPSAVESWEQGKRQPSGSASQLIRVLERHPKLVKELV